MKKELCAASVKAIQLAKKYNFDRIELCQNLEQGGTTPSIGMIQFAVSSAVKTHVLIRQRSGDFIYSQDEIQVMTEDKARCIFLLVIRLLHLLPQKLSPYYLVISSVL